MLANLLTNAAKYTNPGGQISVTVELSGADAGRDQDNGIGIRREDAAHVFEVYPRHLPFDTTAGLGIGLALVRGLLNLHCGNDQANSAGRRTWSGAHCENARGKPAPLTEDVS